MAVECSYNKFSSTLIGYLKTTTIGMNITKEIRILTLKAADKWPSRDHFEMLALENSKLGISIDWLEFVINIQYLPPVICFRGQ